MVYGANCTYLNLAHAEIHYGFQPVGYHSWGGHCVYDESSEKYIGFFSFMTNHCTLSEWKTNSQIIMTTADEAHGPYDNINYETIIPPWSHNTYIVNYTRSSSLNQYIIWHIGNGTTNKEANCTSINMNNNIIINDNNNKLQSQTLDSNINNKQYKNSGNKLKVYQESGLYYAVSNNSVTGPYYENLSSNSISNEIIVNETWVADISNPAPFIFDNGTVLLYFSTGNCPQNWGLAPRCISTARSIANNDDINISPWKGPYETIGSLPIVSPESEDPSVWQDPRGNFHLLTNVNTGHKRCNATIPCSGHAWSYDGLTWSKQFIGAFGPIIRLKNGTQWVNAYVERPQVYQNPGSKIPVAFFVGMGRSQYSDSISWAQPFCNQQLLDQGLCDPMVYL